MNILELDINEIYVNKNYITLLREQWVRQTGQAPVGSCKNSIYEMHQYLINLNKKKNSMELDKYTYQVKAGSENLVIGGSWQDITKWGQKQIIEFLLKYPKAEGHFEKTLKEVKEKKEMPNEVIIKKNK